jgi:hypothetical protein
LNDKIFSAQFKTNIRIIILLIVFVFVKKMDFEEGGDNDIEEV